MLKYIPVFRRGVCLSICDFGAVGFYRRQDRRARFFCPEINLFFQLDADRRASCRHLQFLYILFYS